MTKFIAMLDDLATRALQRLREEDLRPQTWKDVLETLQALGQHIPHETVVRLSQSGG